MRAVLLPFLALFWLVTPPAQAACREDAQALAADHGAPAAPSADDAAWDALNPDNDFWACARLPDSPDLLAVARALPSPVLEGETTVPDVDFLDLEVSVFDTRTRKLVARLLAPRELKEDAETLDGLSFDETPYALDARATVFGIHASFTARAGLVRAEHTMLAVFALRAGALSQLVSALPLHSVQGLPPPEEAGDCQNSANFLERSLAVAKTSSHGLRDLAVTTRTHSEHDAPNCMDDTAKPVAGPVTTKATLLRFDGRYYSLVPLRAVPPPVVKSKR